MVSIFTCNVPILPKLMAFEHEFSAPVIRYSDDVAALVKAVLSGD
jgi:hypothetical protein